MRYFLILLFFIPSVLFGAVLVYNKDTGEPIEWIVSGKSAYESDPNYLVVHTDVPPDFDTYKVDTETKQIITRPIEEKQAIIKERRRREIRRDVRKLKQRYLETMSERAEGFDVATETTTIRATIEQLKQEFLSLD